MILGYWLDKPGYDWLFFPGYGWRYFTVPNSNYKNNLGVNEETIPVNITGKFDSSTNTLTGTLNYLRAYPFTAKVSISGSGQSESATIESLTFNGYTYSESSIQNFKEAQNLMNNIIQELMM